MIPSAGPLFLLQLLLAAPPQASAAAAGIPFHRSEAQVIPSPDGRHRLRIRRGKAVLETARRGPTRLLLRIPRSGSALWSPDGRVLALNDEFGSNGARAFLFDAAGGRRLADLASELERSFPEDVWAGHRYVRAEAWRDASTLEVLVEGHADAARTVFRMRYRRTADGTWTRLLRQRQGPGAPSPEAFSEPCPRD